MLGMDKQWDWDRHRLSFGLSCMSLFPSEKKEWNQRKNAKKSHQKPPEKANGAKWMRIYTIFFECHSVAYIELDWPIKMLYKLPHSKLIDLSSLRLCLARVRNSPTHTLNIQGMYIVFSRRCGACHSICTLPFPLPFTIIAIHLIAHIAICICSNSMLRTILYFNCGRLGISAESRCWKKGGGEGGEILFNHRFTLSTGIAGHVLQKFQNDPIIRMNFLCTNSHKHWNLSMRFQNKNNNHWIERLWFCFAVGGHTGSVVYLVGLHGINRKWAYWWCCLCSAAIFVATYQLDSLFWQAKWMIRNVCLYLDAQPEQRI